MKIVRRIQLARQLLREYDREQAETISFGEAMAAIAKFGAAMEAGEFGIKRAPVGSWCDAVSSRAAQYPRENGGPT